MSGFEEYPHFFEVELDLFKGPIDLLLHLVKQNELPIEKLSLAQVTEQYLECLEKMRRFDLEVAGEYLVIAATLISIKSSLVLQDPVELIEDEDGNLVDPHEELLRRLREAEVFKEGARLLTDRGQLGIDVFSPPSRLRSFKGPTPKYGDHDPMLLGFAFQKILKQASDSSEPQYMVNIESVSIVERMMGVLEQLKEAGGPIAFEKLIPDVTSKASIVGTFICLLELCKRQVICVQQGESEEVITVVLAASAGESIDTASLASEFDVAAGELAAVQEA